MLARLFHTHPADASIWLTVGILQLLTVLAVFRGGAYRKYLAFAAFIFFQTTKTALLMALPPGDNSRIYTWIHFPWSLVQCALAALVVYDLYAKVLGYRRSLPDWEPRNIKTLLFSALGLATALTLVFRPQFGGIAIQIMAGIKELMFIGLSLALWVLAYRAHRLGRPWWPRHAHIAFGLVLSLSANAIAAVVVAVGSKEAGWVANGLANSALAISLGWWNWFLWSPEPVLDRATPEEYKFMLEHFKADTKAVAVAEKALG